MFRYFTIALVLIECFAVISCQKYSSGLVQSAARGDEAVVFSNLRSIMQAQNAYNLGTGNYGTFEQLTDGAYLDTRFKGDKPSVNEYVYTIGLSEKTYTCNADPARTGDRAGRHFYIDSNSNDIHVNASQPATSSDEIIKP